MFSFIYNAFLLLIGIIALPKLLWHWFVLGKYRQSLKERLGFSLPSFTPKQEVIWIHAVSMGETRAIIPLYRLIRKNRPDAAVVISTTTETGNSEAKRSMPDADAFFFLPLDFSWIIRRLLKRIRPTTLILCESDLWYHLLKITKENKAKIALVNGKISLRSTNRFQKVSFFTKRLFSSFDILCVQSNLYRERFLSLGIPPEKLIVTGNLKLDAPSKKMDATELQLLRKTFEIAPSDPVLVIGSTHAPEEEEILALLPSLWQKIPQLKVLLVPRHPERFAEVFELIQAKGFSCSRYTDRKSDRLILVDTMGLLHQCYQLANVAIVGGSFTPTVGGHNIMEPVLLGVPVLFGPHMYSQPDLTELVLSAHAGKQLTIDELPAALLEILGNPKPWTTACEALNQSVQGASQRTFDHIFSTN
jgi:3-deoxy-D-manno-octulosonic-acid transferase